MDDTGGGGGMNEEEERELLRAVLQALTSDERAEV